MNINELRVSIIVPASNCENTIEKCIASIYDNKYKDIECIVIVNNSSDNTFSICLALKSKYECLVVIESNAKGVSAARNEGIRASTGGVIGFCDADDYYEPQAIDNVLKKFKCSSADIVVTGFYRVSFLDNSIHSSRNQVSTSDKFVSVKRMQGLVLNDISVLGCIWNKFYRKDVLFKCSFNENLSHSEDTHFNMQILKKNNLRIILTPLITYNYVCNHSSATNSIDRCYTDDDKLKYLIAFEKIQNDYNGNAYVKKETMYSIVGLAIDNYRHELSKSRKEHLRWYVVHYYHYILLKYFKYGIKRNTKRLIKGALILVKMY